MDLFGLLGNVLLVDLPPAVLVVVVSIWAYRAHGAVSGCWLCAWVLLQTVLDLLFPFANSWAAMPATRAASRSILGHVLARSFSITTSSHVTTCVVLACGALSKLAIYALICTEIVRALSATPVGVPTPVAISWLSALYPHRNRIGMVALALQPLAVLVAFTFILTVEGIR